MLPCGVAHPRLPERGNRFLVVTYRRRDGRRGVQRLAGPSASITLVASTGLTRC
jgi:hypothetical protein